MAHALSHPFDDIFDDRDSGTLVKRPSIDPRLLIAIVGAALLGAALASSAPHVIEAYETATAQAPPAAASLQPAELPREWRWEPKTVEYEHMYRQKR
jgi:hypothetical protein